MMTTPTKSNVLLFTPLQLHNNFFPRPTFATAQRTAMDLSVSRERAFL